MKKISHSKNSVLTLLSWLIPLVLTVFATPYIIVGLGNEQYGLYTLMIGFISYSFTLNFGRAITKYLVEYNITNEVGKKNQIISASFFLAIIFATIGSGILVLLSRFLVENVFRIEAETSELTISALRLVAVCIWLISINQIFTGIIQGRHRFDIFSLITTITNSLFIIGSVILVWRHADFRLLIIWNISILVASTFAGYLIAKKIEPETKIKFNFSKEMLALSFKYGSSIAIYQIITNIIFFYERVIITRLTGAENLTFYAVPMSLAIYIHVFVSNLTLNLMPITSEMFAANKITELEMIYRRITKIVVAVVFAVCVSLAVGSNIFLTNWINTDFASRASDIFIFHIISFGALAVVLTSWQFIEGFGLPLYNSVNSLSWLIITLLVMYPLTLNYGMWGTALSRTLSLISIPIAIVIVEKKIFGKILSDLWMKILAIVIIASVAGGGTEYILIRNLPHNWFTVVATISVCGLIFGGVLLMLSYFSKDEKIWIRNVLKRVYS